jgi:hypothetical protein
MTGPAVLRRALGGLLPVLAVLVLGSPPSAAGIGSRERGTPAQESRVRGFRAGLPLRFEPDGGRGFFARCGNYRLFLRDGEAVFALQRPTSEVGPGGWSGHGRRPVRTADGSAIRMRFGGGAPAADLGILPGVSHYLFGNDPSLWRTGVPAWNGVAYRGVRPGVDLLFHGNPRDLEYNLRVAPGGDPRSLELVFEGAASAEVDGAGDLVLRTPDGDLRHRAPVAWQEGPDGSREPVAARWALAKEGHATFELGPWDRKRPLVVDPTVSYATYLGGGDLETVWTMRVDPAGSPVMAGWSRSSNFPTVGAYQGSSGGGLDDAFVSKLTPDGTALSYSTYIGGSGYDEVLGMDLVGDGSVVLGGITSSTNYPTVSPLQASNAGGSHDGFVTRLAPGGASLTYSTYFGGSGFDDLDSIRLGPGGVYQFCGATSSTNFPLASPFQSTYGGGSYDGYVACIGAAGNSVVYSSYLGGTGRDAAIAIGVDGGGNAHLAGFTESTNFPVINAFQGTYGGGTWDCFLCAVGPAGGTPLYSTYLGGSGFDYGLALVSDAAGTVTVAGYTSSTNFPVVNAVQAANAGGGDDAFLLRMNASGSAIVYSTYLGGSNYDQAYALAVDASGAAYVGGFTYSTDFPVKKSTQAAFGGGTDDAFVAKVAPGGSPLVFSTYIGGNGYDEIYALEADGLGGFIAGGVTSSADFPVRSPYQGSYAGGSIDGFVAHFVPVPPIAPSGLTAQATGVNSVHLAWTDNSTDETSFEIQRRVALGPFGTLSNAAADAKAFDDVAASPKTTFTYRVRTVNDEGFSPWSNEASATTAYNPAPPTGFVATAVSTTGIDLAWTDASDNETGFEVSRATGTGPTAILATVPQGTTAHQDRGLLPDQEYTYRLRAIGAYGTSAYASDASALTPPSITISLAKGALKDGAKFGKDKATLSFTVAILAGAPDGAFDPVADGMSILVGEEAAPLAISVPPGSGDWVSKKGRFTWKSAKGTVPKVVLTYTPATAAFAVKVSKAQFPAAPANPVRLSLRGGNDGGSLRVDWTGKKAGSLAYP